MNLPRSSVPVGALWNLATGPIGPGAETHQLTNSTSVSYLQLGADQQAKASMELGILNFLNAGGNGQLFTDARLSLENLSIVTLNSIDILKMNVGQHVLYEALKADNFKITIDKSKLADAKLSLTNLFKNKVNFGAETTIDNKTTIDIGGTDLFLAYRVIKIEKAKKKSQKLKFKSQSHGGTGSFTISSRYEAITPKVTVQICPCNIIGCMIDEGVVDKTRYQPLLGGCARNKGYDMTVILNDDIDMTTGKPKEFYFKVKSGSDIRNVNQSLYTRPTSEGLEAAYVSFEKIIFEVIARMEKTYLIYMLTRKGDQKASLIVTSFEFKNIAPNTIAGW